jgi:hypothetical protein
MAYGQIDPARLEGEALRRWYLRSPVEIEEERKSTAAAGYDQFFSPRNLDPRTSPCAVHQRQSGARMSKVW